MTTVTRTPPASPPAAAPDEAAQRGAVLLAVCAATGLLLLNVSAPNVALPNIGRGLGASFSDLQWIISGYALTLAATLLSAGAIADRFGRRRLFLIGLVGFTAASAVCAVAPVPVALVVGRATQGVFGAVVFSASLAILADTFRGSSRGRALGVWGATVAAAFAIGPLEGGLLTEYFGWRAIFVVDVLVALLVLPLTLRRLTESRDPDGTPFDPLATATLVPGLVLAVFAVIRGNSLGWGSAPILSAATAALVLLAGFVLVEHRQRRPMLDLDLFRSRTFTGASVIAVLFAASTFGPVLYLTLFLLSVEGSSPPVVGLQLTPFALVSLLVSVVGGRYSARLPLRGVLVGGLLLCAAGVALMAGTAPGTTWVHFVPGMILAGAGTGLVNPAMTFAALAVVPTARSGMASGANNTFRQLGVAGGIAGLGALVERGISSGLVDRLHALPAVAGRGAGLADRAAAGDLAGAVGSVPATARAAFVAAYDAAFASTMNTVFLLSAGLAVLGALAAWALVRPAELTRPTGAAPPGGGP